MDTQTYFINNSFFKMLFQYREVKYYKRKGSLASLSV